MFEVLATRSYDMDMSMLGRTTKLKRLSNTMKMLRMGASLLIMTQVKINNDIRKSIQSQRKDKCK